MNWQAFTAQADELGESPFWHPQEKRLYWVDIPAQQIRRSGEAPGTVESWAMPMEPGCIAPAKTGGLVIALRDGIYRAREWGGELSLLARFNHDPATTRFNDGKADPLGRLWAGTMYEPRDSRKAELYSVDCRPGNGQGGKPLVQLKAHNATIANGLAWSPGGDTVYWADTTQHIVHAWDWEASSSAMRRHRVFIQQPGKPAGWKSGDAGYGGRPDGAAVDVQGNYWSAQFEGGRLLKFSPAGELLADIAVPALCPTMPCFGGEDGKTLFLTSTSYNRSPQELAKYPLSGRVFSTRVDVPGLPVNFFSD